MDGKLGAGSIEVVVGIKILTSTDKPRQLTILKTSMQGNPNSNQNASQPQFYRLLDKLTNALKSKIMTRLAYVNAVMVWSLAICDV